MSLLNTGLNYKMGRNMIVSILVLVDVALELSTNPNGFYLSHMVSILVLVDVALEQYRSFFPGVRICSFNPCSRGCRS